MAEIKEQRKDNFLCHKGEQDERNFQEKVSWLVETMSKKFYGLKVTTLLNTADKLTADLNYLCSIIEQPDFEFPVGDAVAYARTVLVISDHLDFVLEDLAERDLSEDEEYVKLSEEDVMALNLYTEASEDALQILEETCGISLKSN